MIKFTIHRFTDTVAAIHFTEFPDSLRGNYADSEYHSGKYTIKVKSQEEVQVWVTSDDTIILYLPGGERGSRSCSDIIAMRSGLMDFFIDNVEEAISLWLEGLEDDVEAVDPEEVIGDTWEYEVEV